MGTLFDYVDWRGDLSFREAPLNEVDALIFSLISYIDFGGILSPEHDGATVPIKAAANAFFSKHPDLKSYSMGLILPKGILNLLRAIKDTKRFRNVEMVAFVNDIDTERQMQFSAVTFLLGNYGSIVTFRGTDDSIIGWKENFNMSFLSVVPAQIEAARYLDLAANRRSGQLYVAGHSKGGNLAVYAAVNCEKSIQGRLEQVWSFDGPGFGHNILEDPDYLRMRPVIKNLLPQSAVVGMLLEHEELYTVIKSRQSGLLQHDGLTWEVMGGSFVRAEALTEESLRTARTLHAWVHEMTPEERELFVDSLYQLLSSDNAVTLSDLASLKNRWLLKKKELDPTANQAISKTLNVLVGLVAKSMIGDIFKKSSKKK